MDKQVLARWIAGLERNGITFTIEGSDISIDMRPGAHLPDATISLLRQFEGQIREHLAGQVPVPEPETQGKGQGKGEGKGRGKDKAKGKGEGKGQDPNPCAHLCPCSRCRELRGEKTPPPMRRKPGLYRRVRAL